MSLTTADRVVRLLLGVFYIGIGIGILFGYWPSGREIIAYAFLAFGNLLMRPNGS